MFKTIYTRKEIISKLRQLGFEGLFSGGKHQFMKKADSKLRIPNVHQSGDIHVSLLKELLKQARIIEDEWNNLD